MWLATATAENIEPEPMNPWIKALFILVVLGLFVPVLWNIIRTTTLNQRQRTYDRQRNRGVKPIGTHRYNRLWVVDRDLNDNEGVTVHTRRKNDE